jgi:hypothetical protein
LYFAHVQYSKAAAFTAAEEVDFVARRRNKTGIPPFTAGASSCPTENNGVTGELKDEIATSFALGRIPRIDAEWDAPGGLYAQE